MEKTNIRTHTVTLATGIQRTPKFAEKGLAAFAVNPGTKCGHGCTYCSTACMLRMHPSFTRAGENPFEEGFAIVDPETPDRVAHDAQHMRKRGLVQVSTTVDSWSPEALTHNLGRRILEAILSEPGWTVRILTKNAAIVQDFDLIQRYRDRVLVGLSLTATPDRDNVIRVVEPYASSISERMDALARAREMGLRTFGMLCPLLPGIGDGADQIGTLVDFVISMGAEQVFAEAVNPRGPNLIHTEVALREASFEQEALAVGNIRRKRERSTYIVALLANLQAAMRKHGAIERLRYLLYPKNLNETDRVRVIRDDQGVIWL